MKLFAFLMVSLSFLLFACDFAPADINSSTSDPVLGNVPRERIDRNVLDVVIFPPENGAIRTRSTITFNLQYNAMRNTVVLRELDSDGDGDFDRVFDGPGIRVSAFYYAPGEYEPVVRVTDDRGYYSVATCRITVVE